MAQDNDIPAEETELPELNEQQELFCLEYVIDFNGSKAAIRAGYSEQSSRSIASTMLTKHNIQNRIKELKEGIFAAVGITQAKIYRELARISLSDIRQAFDENGALKSIKDLPDDIAAAIVGIESFDERDSEGTYIGTTRKVKFADKLNGIAQIIKIAGWAAPEKTELSGPNGQPLQVQSQHKVIIEDFTNGALKPEEPGE